METTSAELVLLGAGTKRGPRVDGLERSVTGIEPDDDESQSHALIAQVLYIVDFEIE